MDPLVRAALGLQRGLFALFGSAISMLAGAFLVLAPEAQRKAPLGLAVLCGLTLSLAYRLFERYRRLGAKSAPRLEVEIGFHLSVLLYAGISLTPGGVAGPYQPLAYVLMMWSGGFLCPVAAGATFLGAATLEASLALKDGLALTTLFVHVGLLASFSGLNLLVFRSEIARVRRLSRERVAAELKRVRDEARSYRLLGAPRSAVRAVASGARAPSGDEERLTHSSVEQLQLSLKFVLSLLRAALSARTAAVLWLDKEAQVLHLREVSSTLAEVSSGPFAANEGLFAAAIASGTPMQFEAGRVAGRLPLYPGQKEYGEAILAPLREDGSIVGFVVVEGEPGSALNARALATLEQAVEFILRSVESERVFIELERAKTEQGKLYAAADLLAAARTEIEVIQAGVESARQFTRFDFAAVTIFHRTNKSHEICAVSGEGADELVGRVFRHNAGLVSMVVANQHPLPYRGVFQPARQMVFDRHLTLPNMPSLIILPLCVHEAALGTLMLGSNTLGAFGEELRPTLEVLARHVAVSLANARMVKRLEDLATTDGLTGLLNKRTLTEVARQKLRSAQRFNKPLTLIIGDIDHFKKVNDGFGHDVGDLVIQGFGEVLRRSKRETDSVGRFGGEEFVVVCEHTDEEGALLLANRIRQELEATTFHTQNGSLHVTCSLGVATFPQAGNDWESLFKATDEALYVSKNQGRNRVTRWQPNMRGAAA